MEDNKIFITGSTGFVGKALLNYLSTKGFLLVAPVRKPLNSFPNNVDMPLISDIADFSDNHCHWLNGCGVVVHIAAKAHVKGVDLSEFRRVNTLATLNLARFSARSGVKRFVFLSSIGVNGTCNTSSFLFDDRPSPTEDYAVSKLEAEVGLKKIAEETGMEVVIIRPPLIYGPGAPGNFGTLLKVAKKNLPLPLGAIDNKRSFVAIDNLVDLIVNCIDNPAAANQTFLVSDDEIISTSELLKKITLAAGKKPMLMPVPVSVLKFLAGCLGRKAVVDRFTSSLTVDIEHTKKTLGWNPIISLDEGIRRCFK